jgi:DNA-binding transcriptional MocR family regulator
VCLDELERRIKCCNLKACVFVLNYNNPLGSCMPDAKKEQLVKLLTRLQVPLIEDDIYGNLTFSPTRPKVAKAYDTEGWVMLCDSFTKTLAPGYRVGWVAPGRFREKVEFLKYINTSCNPALPQMAVAEFLGSGGYDHHLRKIRRLYASQVQLMGEAVGRYFPEGTRSTRPTGGVCLWVELPKQVEAIKLYRDAAAAGISIAPGALFAAKNKYSNFIRLNCGNPWSETIENAMKTLGQLAAKQLR